MATVQCAPGARVSLPTGCRLLPGQSADADASHPDVRGALEDGRLILIEDFDVTTAKVDDVLTWVGDDPERASAALALESGRPEREQRSTLIDKLTGLVDSEPDSPEED